MEEIEKLVEETTKFKKVREKIEESGTFKQEKGLKYDPSKPYKWEPGTQFLLSGEEFGVILNSIRAILNSPEGRLILLADQANKAVETSLARAVEIGLVQEQPTSPKK